MQRQEVLALQQKEEARRQELKENAAARKKAEEERVARQERLECVLQSARRAEARERELDAEMERLRLVAQQQARDGWENWLREEKRRQKEVQEAAKKTQREIEETSRRRVKEEEERLRANQELEEKRQQEARQEHTSMSVAAASARQRIASLVAAEERARSELQAMLDRKSFIAEAASQVRDDVEKAQGIIDAFKASAESHHSTVVQYEFASHAQSTHRV